MCTLHCSGVIFFILGLEIVIRVRYNFFGDPAALLLIVLVLLGCMLLMRLLLLLADILQLWQARNQGTAWHVDALAEEGPEEKLPGWDELEKMRGAAHEQYLMNQKLTSETFRFKFLDYNREWLVQQLPNILTPRTLRRARPYLIAQFARILGTVNPDISSDEDDDDDMERRFGPVDLGPTSRTIARMWLSLARRRLRLKEVVRPFIARQPKEIQAELYRCVDPLGDRFEKENPDMEEFDQVKWKRFFEEHALPFMRERLAAEAGRR